jgi:hypothetical protein
MLSTLSAESAIWTRDRETVAMELDNGRRQGVATVTFYGAEPLSDTSHSLAAHSKRLFGMTSGSPTCGNTVIRGTECKYSAKKLHLEQRTHKEQPCIVFEA